MNPKSKLTPANPKYLQPTDDDEILYEHESISNLECFCVCLKNNVKQQINYENAFIVDITITIVVFVVVFDRFFPTQKQQQQQQQFYLIVVFIRVSKEETDTDVTVVVS